MDAYDTITLENGVIVKIYTDDMPMNPREWDNLGKMVCSHRNYNLGDEQLESDQTQEFLEWMRKNRDKLIVLPLFLYDHSGITISTMVEKHWWHSNWDAGLVGYIYVEKETLRKEFGWKLITKKREQQIIQCLKNEVEVYDDYLTGYVFGFKAECPECGEELDSEWGFYGDNWQENGLMDEVKGLKCDACEAALIHAWQNTLVEVE